MFEELVNSGNLSLLEAAHSWFLWLTASSVIALIALLATDGSHHYENRALKRFAIVSVAGTNLPCVVFLGLYAKVLEKNLLLESGSALDIKLLDFSISTYIHLSVVGATISGIAGIKLLWRNAN